MTLYEDNMVMAVEAELIHAFAQRGVALPTAEQMELWELAAACGVHRIETWEDRNDREIVEKKEAYWQETKAKRVALLEEAKQRRGKKVT